MRPYGPAVAERPRVLDRPNFIAIFDLQVQLKRPRHHPIISSIISTNIIIPSYFTPRNDCTQGLTTVVALTAGWLCITRNTHG